MAKQGRGRPIVETLTPSQQRLLKAIETHIKEKGESPTLREMASELDQGVASIFNLVKRLERNGFVSRSSGKTRSLTVLKSATEQQPAILVAIPLLGTVAAGAPMFAPENMLGEILVHSVVIRSGRHFALTVVGQSMVDAGIDSGDVLIVRQQPLAEHRDIVVALLNDEATVKRLHLRDSQIMLLPENARFKPISVGPDDDLRIVGKVIAVRHGADQKISVFRHEKQ